MRPANCGFVARWSPRIREVFAGAPLKSIALMHGEARVRGEAVVTAEGIEGGAVYALSAGLREAIAAEGFATLTIDFKPDVGEAALAARLMRKPGQSVSTYLRKAAGLSPVAVALLREAGPLPEGAEALSRRIKRCRTEARRARADRSRHLDRGRRRMERDRRRFHANEAPWRLCRRRDDRLGGANRRLSAAGLLCDRRRRGPGRGPLGGAKRAGCAGHRDARSVVTLWEACARPLR